MAYGVGLGEVAEEPRFRCPYDGIALNWDDPCRHLIADWSDDETGEGPLEPGDRGNPGLKDLAFTHQACSHLCNVAMGRRESEDDVDDLTDEQLRALTAYLFGSAQSPAWWAAVQVCLDSQEGHPGPVEMEMIVKDSVGSDGDFKLESMILGGMVSLGVTVLWASDPDQGIATLGRRLDEVASEMKAAADRLAASGWRGLVPS